MPLPDQHLVTEPVRPEARTISGLAAPDLDLVVARNVEAVSCVIANETVILEMNSGIYFGLDPVGTSIWNLLTAPRRIGEIRDELMQEYDVDASACEAAVARFVRRMAEKGLVTVSGK